MWRVLAKFISGIFSPFLIPSYIYITLIFSSYLAILPINSILIVIGVIAFFTAIVPLISIAWNNYNIGKNGDKERSYPFLITGICYMFLAYILLKSGVPVWIASFTFSGIVLLIMLAILKKNYNVSIHMTAFGAYLGAIFSIIEIQGNIIPLEFIATTVLICGALGSARAYLKDYTPGGIITGVVLGFVWSYYMAFFTRLLF